MESQQRYYIYSFMSVLFTNSVRLINDFHQHALEGIFRCGKAIHPFTGLLNTWKVE